MTFGNIYWLYAFIPVLLILLIGFRYSQKKRQYFFKSLVSAKLQEKLMSTYSTSRHLLKSILFLLSIFFFFIALAQPRWGYTWQEQKSKGIDILFALDVSKSMLAEDIRPNRLERAKYAILDLIKKLEGDRFGLIAFAGSAFLQCPLTLDYNAFRESLEQTDPSVIYRGGTDIGAAIQTAEPVFAKENSYKILILITDGEDLEESGITAASNASKDDIKIYTVGVGTPQGELIPIKDKNNNQDYLRDAEGKLVKTKLDESTLRKIAEVTGGFYVPLGAKGEGLDQIYYSGLKNIPKQDLSSNLKQIPIERFQWPLGIGILLLCIETLLSTRKNSQNKRHTPPSLKAIMLVVCLSVLSLSANRLDASITGAYKAYQEGQFNKASVLYQKEQQKDTENSIINYNLGNSFYKDVNYTLAINALENALKTQDLELQQKAFYNLGNAYFRSGEQSLQTNPKQTIEFWEEALKNYQNAIELNSQDSDAQQNLEFVKKKLEELKHQQQQQDKQDQQNQKNQENQQNQEQDSKEKKNENNAENDPKNDSNKDNNKESENKENKDNEQSANQKNNPESPPNEPNKEPEKNNHNQQNKDPSKPSNSDKKEQSEQQSHRRMDKQEAGELLKVLQNSEKKLPAMGEKSANHSNNFKDW